VQPELPVTLALERLALPARALGAALDLRAAHERQQPQVQDGTARAGPRRPMSTLLPPMKAKSETSTASPSGTRISAPPMKETTVSSTWSSRAPPR
jgi:hypothetical protein